MSIKTNKYDLTICKDNLNLDNEVSRFVDSQLQLHKVQDSHVELR